MLDLETVFEGLDVEFVQQSGSTGGDLLSLFDKMYLVLYFNLPLDDLCADSKSLEEGGAAGVHARGPRRNKDIHRSEDSLSCGSRNLVLIDDITDLTGLDPAEHKPDIEFNERQQDLKLRHVSKSRPQGRSNHGVLAHQYLGLSSKGHANGSHLSGAHMISRDDQHRWVVRQKLEETRKILPPLRETLRLPHSLLLRKQNTSYKQRDDAQWDLEERPPRKG